MVCSPGGPEHQAIVPRGGRKKPAVREGRGAVEVDSERLGHSGGEASRAVSGLERRE